MCIYKYHVPEYKEIQSLRKNNYVNAPFGHSGLDLAPFEAMFNLNSATNFLFQIGRTLPDTVLTRQVATDTGFFDKVSTIGGAILSIAVLLLAIGLLIAAWNFGKAVKGFLEFLRELRVDMAPVIRNVTVVSEDVQDITKRARKQAEKVDEKVDQAHAMVDKAFKKTDSIVENTLKKTDSQVRRFQSFVGMVQDKIESGFISAASTVRGVQTGIEKMVEVERNSTTDIEDDLDHFNDEDFYETEDNPEFTQREEPRLRSRKERKI